MTKPRLTAPTYLANLILSLETRAVAAGLLTRNALPTPPLPVLEARLAAATEAYRAELARLSVDEWTPAREVDLWDRTIGAVL